jgi:hypothetical protein
MPCLLFRTSRTAIHRERLIIVVHFVLHVLGSVFDGIAGSLDVLAEALGRITGGQTQQAEQ